MRVQKQLGKLLRKLCGAFSRGSLTSNSLFYLCLTDQAIQYLLAPAVQRFICLFVAFSVCGGLKTTTLPEARVSTSCVFLPLSFKFLFYHSWSATWNHRATEITQIYARSFLKAMSSSVSPKPLFAGLVAWLTLGYRRRSQLAVAAGQDSRNINLMEAIY